MPLKSPVKLRDTLQLSGVTFTLTRLWPQVAAHAGDRLHVDQRRAVDLPEQLGVELSTSS